MDIYTYLKKDHKVVMDLFDAILATKSMDKRKSLFEELSNELLLHAETEDATFYEALRNHPETTDLIEDAEEEHEEAKDYIEKLSRLSIESEKWMEQFGEFKHAINHHVTEEEEEMFEEAKKILSADEAKQLAADMDEMKQEMKDKS